MSRVLSRDTTAELILRKAMWAGNARGYRLHVKILGRPDIVFVGKRVAIFVDGCFWHGCRCKRKPKRNAVYWIPKIQGNRRRDRYVTRVLQREGWTVLRFWEHEVRADVARCIVLVTAALRSSDYDDGARPV